jgi:Uma2 family endonuclease
MNLMVPVAPALAKAVEYPDDDRLPMAGNSRQLRWIVTLYDNLCALLRSAADVFVAGNHLWYPLEGRPEVRTAPDVMVVFGRPKGDRSSYKQWEEDGIPVTVAFEVLSPGNTVPEMADKFAFYEDHGAEEYYLYDPDNNRLYIFVRQDDALVRVPQVDGFVSPRLGIRFDLSGPEMLVFSPDGRRFRTFEELEAERVQAEQRATDAERQAELMRRILLHEATEDERRELQQLLEQQPPPA